MDRPNELQYKIHEIIDRIRELRQIEGLSEADMARRLGMSEDDYIDYESGREELNFGFLYTVSKIFAVDVGELIEGMAPRLSSYILTRAGQGRVIDNAHGMTYYALADKFRGRVSEPLFVHSVFDPDAQLHPVETSTHEGQELDIVIRGHLKVQLGNYTEILGPGDTIYYNSSTPHGLLATNGEDCDFYAIVLNPGDETPVVPELAPVITASRVTGEHRIWENFISVSEDGSGNLKEISFKNAESFNFAFDVIDRLGREKPDKLAMVHIGRDKTETRLTFEDIKKKSGRAANYFRALGIRKGDRVMLVLRRNWQFWPILMGLEKLGAVAIPAVDQLSEKDYLYRFEVAQVKAIVCSADGVSVANSSPAIEQYGKIAVKITANGAVDGWHSFDDEYLMYSSHFVRTDDAISGDDTMMAIFTSGSTGYPKLAVHNCKYPLGHFATARYWHCVDPDGLHMTISDTGWAKAMWGSGCARERCSSMTSTASTPTISCRCSSSTASPASAPRPPCTASSSVRI